MQCRSRKQCIFCQYVLLHFTQSGTDIDRKCKKHSHETKLTHYLFLFLKNYKQHIHEFISIERQKLNLMDVHESPVNVNTSKPCLQLSKLKASCLLILLLRQKSVISYPQILLYLAVETELSCFLFTFRTLLFPQAVQ